MRGPARRSFVVSSLAAAGALVSGVVAVKSLQTDASAPGSPIRTDARGLDAGEVRVPVFDGAIPAYCAQPASAGPFPLALLVHDSQGLNEEIRDFCRRLAKLGYVAIAPDLFWRQGHGAAILDYKERVNRIISKIADTLVMSDLDAAAAYAWGFRKGDDRRLAIAGFGWGGRIAWLYAAHNPALKAAAAWYASQRPPSLLHPKNPVDVVPDLVCPVLALHGGADEIIPQAIVVKRQNACLAQHKTCAFRFYPGVPHGFAIDGRRHYRAAAAADGWTRMLAWFKQYGAAPQAPIADIEGGSHG